MVETCFAQGQHFCEVLNTWLQDDKRSKRLHYVALLEQGLEREEWAKALDARVTHGLMEPEMARQLKAVWPGRTAGVHRLILAHKDITLTLAVGEPGSQLAGLRLLANAVVWPGRLTDDPAHQRAIKHCARLSASGGVLLIPSGHAEAALHLRAAGYEVEGAESPSHSGKNWIQARLRWNKPGSVRAASPRVVESADKRAVVIGAGIAGAAVADRLAQRGWEVCVLDRASEAASGASGLWLGAMHPHFSQDDCLLSRLSRSALMLAVQRWAQLHAQQADCGWMACGVAHPATSSSEEAAMRELSQRLNLPTHVVAFLPQSELSAKAGASLPFGGYWHAEAGVVEARRLIEALLAQEGVDWRAGAEVDRISRVNGQWQALGSQGEVLAQAPVMVIANAGEAKQLVGELQTLHPVRGQMTGVNASLLDAPVAAVVGHGYVLPALRGRVSLGASYDPGSRSLEVLESDHRLNLESLRTLLPDSRPLPADAALEAFVGVRYATRDHLPLIGAVPDLADRQWLSKAAGKRLTELPRQPGLFCAVGYGSRGLTWSVLAGEIIAALIQAEPAPVEAALMDAVDPARFVRRQLRNPFDTAWDTCA